MFGPLTLAQKIGQLLIVGFVGTTPQDSDIQKLAMDVASSRVGGVIAYKRNIENADQISVLNEFLERQVKETGVPPLIRAVDQEGGNVQRLNSKNGFSETPSAKEMAALPMDHASLLYDELARNVKNAGFNWDFAPCMDLDIAGKDGAAIGKWERSYGVDSDVVVSYGGALIDALHSQGCLSCVKHYPGHGSAKGDTHLGFVDVTSVWEEKELEPFYQLGSKAGAVMTAHIVNKTLDPDNPATLSPKILGMLRAQCPTVTIVTDCLQMDAIQQACGSFEEAVVRALTAGVDLIIYANNPQKSGKSSAPGFEPGPDLPERFVAAVQSGLRRGVLTEEQLNERFERVMTLKGRIS